MLFGMCWKKIIYVSSVKSFLRILFLSYDFQVCYYINNSVCNWCDRLQNVADFVRRNDHLLFAIWSESQLREPADILDLYHYSAGIINPTTNNFKKLDVVFIGR